VAGAVKRVNELCEICAAPVEWGFWAVMLSIFIMILSAELNKLD
jgi:hypothetical protein